MNSEQFIKSEKINFEHIKFNAVTKNLTYSNNQEGYEVNLAKDLINDWFNKSIKLVGLEGSLSVNITSIKINKIRKDQYYKYEINLNLKFTENNQTLNKKKIYNINSIEYGEIEGSFTLRDIENLNRNIINKSLKNVNLKFLKM